MFATTSGVADAFVILGIVLLAACVVCCVAALVERSAPLDPVTPGVESESRRRSRRPFSSYGRYAALLGWAGVMFGWVGTLLT